jgi:hypothetical protein
MDRSKKKNRGNVPFDFGSISLEALEKSNVKIEATMGKREAVRHAAGIRRYHNRVVTRVRELFEENQNVCRDEFVALYNRRYKERFPFYWARVHTEFGERFGSDCTAEEARFGKYAELGQQSEDSTDQPHLKSVEEIEEEMEKRIAKYEKQEEAVNRRLDKERKRNRTCCGFHARGGKKNIACDVPEKKSELEPSSTSNSEEYWTDF